MKKLWTVAEVLRWIQGKFVEVGVPSARLDAELIIAHALGVDRVGLYMDLNRPLTQAERGRLRSGVQRRLRREPVQYIVGWRHFRSLCVTVRPGVFIPRPETELAVDVVLEHLRGHGSAVVADIGTGTGCIALAIAKEAPRVRVLATDIDPVALDVAHQNARQLGLTNQVSFSRGYLYEALTDHSRQIDIVVSNPPYIPSEEIDQLMPEVASFEPRPALEGGPDGLQILRELWRDAPNVLAPNGVVVTECGGERQVERLLEFIARTGRYQPPRVYRDLQALPRVVAARLNP